MDMENIISVLYGIRKMDNDEKVKLISLFCGIDKKNGHEVLDFMLEKSME